MAQCLETSLRGSETGSYGGGEDSGVGSVSEEKEAGEKRISVEDGGWTKKGRRESKLRKIHKNKQLLRKNWERFIKPMRSGGEGDSRIRGPNRKNGRKGDESKGAGWKKGKIGRVGRARRGQGSQ